MDNAQYPVAVTHGFHQYADSRQIIDFADILFVAQHFLVNAVKMLGTPLDFRLDARLADFLLNLLNSRINKRLPFLALLLDVLDQIIIFFRFQITQAEVFKFPLDIGNTQTIRQRRINFDGFLGNAFLLVFAHIFERAHIMQTVSQFHHDDADILGHGQKHLAVVFQLDFLFRFIFNAAELGHAIDNHGDFFAEHLRNLLLGVDGILYHIMQERRADGHIINMQFREDFCHMQRMNDVFFPGHPHLPFMCIRSQIIRLANQGNIGFRLIGAHRRKY